MEPGSRPASSQLLQAQQLQQQQQQQQQVQAHYVLPRWMTHGQSHPGDLKTALASGAWTGVAVCVVLGLVLWFMQARANGARAPA